MTTRIAEYIVKRLQEQNVDTLFGVLVGEGANFLTVDGDDARRGPDLPGICGPEAAWAGPEIEIIAEITLLGHTNCLSTW